MQPFGRPTTTRIPDSAGLYDPRPDDDQLNINPLLENAVVRAPAHDEPHLRFGVRRVPDRRRLTYRMNFGPDFTELERRLLQRSVDARPLRQPGREQPEPGRSRRRRSVQPAYDFTYTLDNLLQFNHNIGSKHHFDLTGLYSDPARPLQPRFAVRLEPPVQHAALVRPRFGHGRQRSEPHLRVGARSRTWAA